MMARLSLLTLIFAAGCSSAMMQETMPPGHVNPEEAVVVVYRPTWTNADRDYAVYDGSTLMGFAASGTWFEYRCIPGDHLFMQFGNSGLTDTAVLATLEGGKTYYLRSDTEVILFALRLELGPVRLGSAEMQNLHQELGGCTPMQLVPESAEDFIEAHRERVEARRFHFEALGEAACAVMMAEDGQ